MKCTKCGRHRSKIYYKNGKYEGKLFVSQKPCNTTEKIIKAARRHPCQSRADQEKRTGGKPRSAPRRINGLKREVYEVLESVGIGDYPQEKIAVYLMYLMRYTNRSLSRTFKISPQKARKWTKELGAVVAKNTVIE